MKRKKIPKVSLGKVAAAAGVSKATACYVLRNQAGPSKETRERVLHVAREMGYAPDARMAARKVRPPETRPEELVPIAWINTNGEKDAWQKYRFLSPYYEGARKRAHELGYRLDEIWAAEPGMTMGRISKILFQRSIEGAIITHPVRHFRLNWDYLSGVALEGSVLAPRLHQVSTDHFFNLLLALKVVRRFGYRRIGVCFEDIFGRASRSSVYVIAQQIHATTPKAEQIEPLFYPWGKNYRLADAIVVDWLLRYRPEVVVGHSNLLMKWAGMAGLRVPEDMGIVHIANDDDVSDWAGICSNRRQVGAVTAERVISLLQNRQFGVPKIAVNMTIRGTWNNGRTLLIPKPK